MIVRSAWSWAGAAQPHGRRPVREVHTDHTGAEHAFHWEATDAAEVEAKLAWRASILPDELWAAEVARNVRRLLAGEPVEALTFQHSSAADLAVEALEEVRRGPERADRLAVYLDGLADPELFPTPTAAREARPRPAAERQALRSELARLARGGPR